VTPGANSGTSAINVRRRASLRRPADLVERYPDFDWNSVSPHLKEAVADLNVTAAGRQWIANLHSHVFCAEHAFPLMGRSDKELPTHDLTKRSLRRSRFGEARPQAQACLPQETQLPHC
jgi:hypothetical protein